MARSVPPPVCCDLTAADRVPPQALAAVLGAICAGLTDAAERRWLAKEACLHCLKPEGP